MRVGPRSPRGTHDEPARPTDDIVVFPTGGTIARVVPPAEPADPEPPVTQAHGPEVRREFHARRGHRPGATPGTTSGRHGGRTDIVRPLLVPPRTASRIVLAGQVFELPLPHLRIEAACVDAHLLVWAVAVVSEHERPVPATLHLHGSPSMVVTVLELMPSRRLRWGRERFVRYGIEAIDALAHRIEHAA